MRQYEAVGGVLRAKRTRDSRVSVRIESLESLYAYRDSRVSRARVKAGHMRRSMENPHNSTFGFWVESTNWTLIVRT